VSRYQKGKTNLDFTGARVREWQWHQLGRMQVCTSLQTGNHASTFTGRMPNQQRQSTEGTPKHTGKILSEIQRVAAHVQFHVYKLHLLTHFASDSALADHCARL